MWDENYEQALWFGFLSTQFLYTQGVATGFNYVVAYRDFDDMGLTGSDLDEWKWKLRIMESEALRIINRPAK